MTPRFAQYVDPIFSHVIDTVAAVEQRRAPRPQEVWTQLREQLQYAESQLRSTHGRAWELSKFALSAWIDEILKNTEPWSQNEWLLKNFMEFEHFKTLDAYQMFFVHSKEAVTVPNGEDALETFYICGMLGFRGFYGHGDSNDPMRIEATARQFDLPSSYSEWARETGIVVRERRKSRVARAESHVPERHIVTARPFWPRAWLLWPWLLVAFLAGLDVILWWYWNS